MEETISRGPYDMEFFENIMWPIIYATEVSAFILICSQYALSEITFEWN